MTLFTLFLIQFEPKIMSAGHMIKIQSAIMQEERTALIYLPEGYEFNQLNYPVLYMTDGDTHAKHTAGTISFLAANNLMPEMIVVGVTNTQRTRDLTPMPKSQNGAGGGADQFLKFFVKELVPTIEKNYRTQKKFRVFAGHSHGATFALNALLNKDKTFQAFIAVSPSLWWGDDVLVKKAQEVIPSFEREVPLYLSLGEEGDYMAKPLAAFEQILETEKSHKIRWKVQHFPDEDHGTVVLRSHYYGLKHVFEGWRPPGEAFESLASITAHYKKVSKQFGFEILPKESTINWMGYREHARGNSDEALKLLEWNSKTYPDSANTHDSLGEILEGLGKLDRAVQCYQKAFELAQKVDSPHVQVYKTNFERLKKAKH